MEIESITQFGGFNPCFIGLASATQDLEERMSALKSFNPCFIGLASATK